jgi:uncharacterized protein YqgV (UPF0045/DUF77 family)
MSNMYSRRHRPPPDDLRYDFPDHVRTRLFSTLEHLERTRKIHDFNNLLANLESRLTAEYGHLAAPGYAAARVSGIPIVEHFFSCDDDQLCDFLEMTFQTGRRLPPAVVDEINRVLREEGIGYELTQMTQQTIARRNIDVYPQMIRKADEFTHEHIIKPSLQVLQDRRFSVANAEMLRAHEEFRKGKLADAITDCGAAFESVLKTICDAKGWAYDPDKDTVAKLVSICRDNGLFPGFYAPIFEGTGTVRNRLGDAHGRGPAPLYTVEAEHVEHLLQMSAAHIVLLAKLAGL